MSKSKNNNPDSVKPYHIAGASKKDEVAVMFDKIANRYDFLNHLLSLGIDRGWRKKAVREFKDAPPLKLLDIATGTGDFAITALEMNPGKITGIDISEGMLAIGRQKIIKKGLQNKIELQYGDSENLPFPDASYDGAMAAFGVRNFGNLERGLGEIHRVLKPGSKIVVLEFSQPKAFPVKQLYWFYFRYVLPLIGRLVSSDNAAYSYLPESVKAFPDGEAFLQKLLQAGFDQPIQKQLTFGIASIYSGIRK